MNQWVRKHREKLLVLAPLAILMLCQTWVTYRVFTSRFPGGNDFAARWFNGCALIWDGQNPYSEQVTLQTQIQMYGRPALPGEDLVAYSYPIYALFFFWPLCYLQPYALVQAIWMTLMLYGVIAGTILMIQTSRLRLAGGLWIVTIIWAVINYPGARAILLGQMVVLVFCAIGLALWALERKADFWAGVFLAAATIKPQVVWLLVFWLLWWSAWRKRWHLWWGFGVTLAVLSGLGLLLLPSWPADFIRHMLNYADVTISPYYSLTWMIARHFLGWGRLPELLITALLALYLLFEWWRGRRSTNQSMLWVTGLTLNLTFFISVQIATTSYILLLLPIFQLFSLIRRRVPKNATLIILAAELFLFVSQWIVFLTTVQGNFETASVYLLLPLSLLCAQLAARAALVPDHRQ